MIQKISIKNSNGFTLLELLVAMIIFMVGMLGLLESINVSLQHNLKNQLRGEAVRVGERYMAGLRGMPFDTSNQTTTFPNASTASAIRGSGKKYIIQSISQPMGQDTAGTTTRQLTVTVKYVFRNQSSLNRVVSVVARP